MARIKVTQRPTPVTIEKFLGINENTTGETELLLGESSNMKNFRIKENFKLESTRGYEQLFDSLGETDIQGMWYGKVGGSFHFLFACNGKIYEHDISLATNTIIGTLTDAKTNFFTFNDKVYIQNGYEYKYFDGTTFGDTEGYVPIVVTATPPSGGGTLYEGINQLTGKKGQEFSADGTETVYQLAETNVISIYSVYVNGVEQEETTDYTVNTTDGTVTFVTAPSTGQNNVKIYWNKANNSRTAITNNRFSISYGGDNDTRIFLYGNGTNVYYYSGLANGVPSAEYFPALNYIKVGSDEFAITDIIRQYSRQIVSTSGKETFYSKYDTSLTDSSGVVIPSFPTKPLNDTVGSVAEGQGLLINNNPFVIESNGIYEWVITNVRDERNVQLISEKISTSLNKLDLSKAITHDCEKVSEYWVAVDNEVFLYNYSLKLWSKMEIYDNITCFLTVNGVVHFGTDKGQIMRFGPTLTSDNGQPKEYYWEMSFYDFNAEWLKKFMTECYISIKPEVRTSLVVQYQTNEGPIVDVETITYNLATYESFDYSDASYLTSYNPQPFRLNLQAHDFVYFKLIFSRTADDEQITILSINLPYRYGGKL